MQDLKEVSQRIHQKKQERKDVHSVYKDVLAQSKPYQDLLEKIKELHVKKVQMQHELQEQCAKEIESVERLALDIKTDEQMLSDIALTKFMKGETIDITDEHDVKYEPVFKVSFKKTG